MIVRVKTAGLLGRYLPAGSARNRADIDVPEDTTAMAMIALLGMPEHGRYLVSVNGTVVPPGQRSGHRLSADDQIAIMPPLRGG